MSKNLLRPALMSAFGVMLTIPMFAHATVSNLTTTTGASKFSVSTTDQDPPTGGATQSVTTSIAKFDASTGVLIGAKVNVSSAYDQTTSVSTPANPGASNNARSTATGNGAVVAKVAVGSAASSTLKPAPQQASCSANRKDGCFATNGPATTTYNTTLGLTALNAYVKAGADNTFDVQTSASVTAQTTANSFAAGATTTSRVDWSGLLSATYEYLLHAQQSFDGSSQVLALDLDFGSVYLGDKVEDQVFSIFNTAGARVGLGLTNVSETGNGNGMFSTNLVTGSSIAAGGSQGFKASFLASELGSFSTSYRLTLADLAPSTTYAANTLYSNYNLTLNLTGTVAARPVQNDVPEPATLMLVGLGAAAFGVSRKRKV